MLIEDILFFICRNQKKTKRNSKRITSAREHEQCSDVSEMACDYSMRSRTRADNDIGDDDDDDETPAFTVIWLCKRRPRCVWKNESSFSYFIFVSVLSLSFVYDFIYDSIHSTFKLVTIKRSNCMSGTHWSALLSTAAAVAVAAGVKCSFRSVCCGTSKTNGDTPATAEEFIGIQYCTITRLNPIWTL